MVGNIQGDKSGKVYTEFDYNNIIIVDPNKTIDSQGNISERLVDHENLIMFANLEAELLPRTKLAVGSSPDSIRTVSIGKINFLNPTKDGYLTTNYYDELTGENSIKGKGTNQTQSEYIPASNGDKGYTKLTALTDGKEGTIDSALLGITSINIKTSGSFIPTVTILLEDVQGRGLFQLGENSPYAAFFHLPYPPFYLTIKGYYGQAVRYQLNLEKFSASFNSMSGNYQITLNLKGYKFNILNEISMGHLLAAPHMFSSRFDISNSNTSQAPSDSQQAAASQQSANIPNASNSKTAVVQQMYSERGYQKIREVYSEYKSKGLIDKDFPELTLQQLMKKLDNFEKNIIDSFPKSDVEPLTNIRTYIEKLKALYGKVIGDSDSWFVKYLNPKPFIGKNGIRYYAYKNEFLDTEKPTAETDLDGIIKGYNEVLDSNPTLGKDGPSKITNGVSVTNMTGITTSADIDWERTTAEQTQIIQPTLNQINELILSYTKLFTPATLGSFKTALGTVGGPTPFVNKDNPSNVLVFLKPYFYIFDGTDRFNEIVQKMIAQAGKVLSETEAKLSAQLADKIRDSKTGIGFVPTVRNIVGVIMASAEGFIRLLDDTHTKAWDVKYDIVRKNAILNNPSSVQGSDTKMVVPNVIENASNTSVLQTPVYPWPQFFFEQLGDDKKGKYQLKYIADPTVVNLTKGYLYDKWPEVEFVEEYIKGLTQKYTEPNSSDDTNIQQFTDFININAIEFPQSDIAYSNKEEVKFFYEIWERQFMTSRYDNLSRFKNGDAEYNELIKLIIRVESKNLLTSLGVSNPYLNTKLKNLKYTASNYVTFLKEISNNGSGQSYIDFIKDIFVTSYIESYTKKSFAILNVDDIGKEPATNVDSTKLESIVKSTQTNEPNITDLYPFTNSTWATTNLIDNNVSVGNPYNTTKVLKIYKQRDIISNFTELNNYTQTRPVTNFSYNNIQNPLSLSQAYSSTNQSGFLINFYYNRLPKSFLPTEGYCYFDVPNNKTTTIFNALSGKLPIRTTTSILNTPFFVNAISEGVAKMKNKNELPFVEAAYLFINSLPLMSLRERYKTESTGLNQLDYMFASLKKFGAIHKLPYAWILKIGSIWYRYKQSKSGNPDFLTKIWKSVDYKKSFDPITNNPSKIYTLDFNGQTGNTIQLESSSSAGINVQSGFYPKLINDFNYFFNGIDLYSTYSDAEIQNTINGGLKLYNFTQSNLNISQNNVPLRYVTWSVLIPNPSNTGYYTVPSFGGSQNQVVDSLVTFTSAPPLTTAQSVLPGYSITGNTSVYNGSMRTLWAAPNYGYFDDTQIVKPDTESYLNEIIGTGENLSPYKLSNQNKYTKIEELFSVFEKEILDTFEIEFLNFSKSEDNVTATPSTKLNYGQSTGDNTIVFKNFQMLFKNLMVINAPQQGVTNETYFLSSINNQLDNFSSVLLKFLQYDVIFKYGNPSNYNRFIFDSFLSHSTFKSTANIGLALQQTAQLVNSGSLATPKIFEPYSQGSLPSANGTTTLIQSMANYPNEWKQLELSVGFSTIPELQYKNTGSYITDFFIDNNIKFTQDNIISLSPLIKMYATQKLETPTLTSTQFNTALNTYLGVCNKLQNDTLDGILTAVKNELPNYQEVPEKVIDSKVDGQQSKVDLYEAFKALNDKWIAGGDYKSKTFFEDILFLDRASRNIGDTLLLDIFTLKDLLNEKNLNLTTSVYTFIGGLLIQNNFTIMNLPAYVNFYNYQVKDGVESPIPGGGSSDFANNMWGTFTTVDYTNAGPKMVCFFVGKPASYLDLPESKNFLFRSDGIQLEKNTGNPLSEDPKGKKDYAKSNKCVGFTVDIGIRNQNVFSSFNVSQENGKGTAESTSTLMNMINQASGRETATQNVSLYNYYAQRSYGCQVISLGNAMIQPTMYFNLRHVPMFNGPYFITDVSHVISPGQFQTTFNGTRQGVFDLPAIDTFLQSINKNLLTKLEKAVLNGGEEKTNVVNNSLSNSTNATLNANNTKGAENSCTTKVNQIYIDAKFESSGATESVINQKDLADKIKKATTDSNLQAIIYALCYIRTFKSNVFHGFNNNLAMLTLVDNRYKTTYPTFFSKYYSCINSEIQNGTQSLPIASFKDIDTFIGFMVSRLSPLVTKISSNIGIGQFYVCEWEDDNQIVPVSNYTAGNIYYIALGRLKEGLESAQKNGITISNFNTLLYGNNNTKMTPTPTPSPLPIVLPPNTNIFKVETTPTTGNITHVFVTFVPNSGLWEFSSAKYNLSYSANVNCAGNNVSTGTITKNQVTLYPLTDILNCCSQTEYSGTYPLRYDVIAKPVLANGQPDTTRQPQTKTITITITKP